MADGLFEKPLARLAAGAPANVGLMQLLAECTEPGQAETALRGAISARLRRGDATTAGRLAAALRLLAATPLAFETVRSTLAGLDHDRGADRDGVAYWAAAFDRAARDNPEASVALYSLGDPALLDAATREVVEQLDAWGFLGPKIECLDLGCGIGRFEIALAPLLMRIVGVDISPAMIAEARRRTIGLAKAEIRETSGRDLGGFAGAAFDLVLAVDAFPYIVQAGLAATMIGEAARVLRLGGRLVILNYSYRGDPEKDAREIAGFAALAGLAVRPFQAAHFKLWDGVAHVLEKPAGLKGSDNPSPAR